MINHSATKPAPQSLRQRLDQFGIGLAGLCAIHCVATIIVVSGLGIGGHFLLSHEIHEFGLLIAVAVAAVAMGWGVWRHRRLAPAIVAIVGLSLMASALMFGHGVAEAVATIIGVTIVSAGHVMNLRALH